MHRNFRLELLCSICDRKPTILAWILALVAFPLAALELEEPWGHLFGGEARVVLLDGSVLEGELTGTPNAQNGMGYIYLHDGEKKRLQAEEIQSLEVTKEKVHNITPQRLFGQPSRIFLSKDAKALQKKTGADFRAEHFRYVDSAQTQKFRFQAVTHKDEVRLLQALNVGFDDRFWVVRRPILLGVFDVEREKYLVSKDGAEPIPVDSGNYREVFEQLFGDCTETAAYSKRGKKFSNFAEHLYIFHRFCSPEGQEIFKPKEKSTGTFDIDS